VRLSHGVFTTPVSARRLEACGDGERVARLQASQSNRDGLGHQTLHVPKFGIHKKAT
jgi:hypothetical protein